MFDRVYLINLKHRPDLAWLISTKMQVESLTTGSYQKPIIFEAIDGNKVGTPNYFQQGSGAWGCLRSHVTCLERCIMDGINTCSNT